MKREWKLGIVLDVIAALLTAGVRAGFFYPVEGGR
jgi:hypothetical protein